MTAEEARVLIAVGESFTVEFKGESRQRIPDDELVEACVCLANGSGGTLFVGVEDDGRITGSQPRTWDDLDPIEFERLRRVIRETRTGDAALAELSDLEIAKALGVVDANGDVRAIRAGALLLFGREESIARRQPMTRTSKLAMRCSKYFDRRSMMRS